MIAALAPIFVGDLAPFSETLVLSDDPREAVTGPALREPETLDRIMGLASRHLGEGDRRALVSLWSIEYVHVLMPAVVVANLVLPREMPVALDEIGVILDDEGIPVAIRLPNDGSPAGPVDAFASFETLVRGNLKPLFETLAAYAGLAPRVLWTNAANLFEAIIRELEKLPDTPRSLIEQGDVLVTAKAWPDGWKNPFRRPVSYADGPSAVRRWRRVCCVRYLIPQYKYCSNCPHLLAEREKETA